jgi:hypothetical protein
MYTNLVSFLELFPLSLLSIFLAQSQRPKSQKKKDLGSTCLPVGRSGLKKNRFPNPAYPLLKNSHKSLLHLTSREDYGIFVEYNLNLFF